MTYIVNLYKEGGKVCAYVASEDSGFGHDIREDNEKKCVAEIAKYLTKYGNWNKPEVNPNYFNDIGK